MRNNNFEIDVLKEFLQYPLTSGEKIFEKFEQIPGAVHRKGDGLKEFMYIKGKKENKVVLAAHVDTVWDNHYLYFSKENNFESKEKEVYPIIKEEETENGLLFRSGFDDYGIGADDRAGCAILWLLKDSGHSLLLLNGEEHGQIGATWLKEENEDIFEEIQNKHQFVIQFDRRHGEDFKCYNVGTDEFRKFIEKETGYSEPDRDSRTDIVVLCEKICGVNLSVGYRYEHKPKEHIYVNEWLNTYKIAKKLLEKTYLKRFELN